jgi:hypothetical protein
MARTRTTSPAKTTPSRATSEGSSEVGMTEPKMPTSEQLAASLAQTGATAEPTQLPPGVEGAAAAEVDSGVTGTWRNGVTVTALWSINEVRNAWMLVQGVGWRKLYNGSDGAFTALTTLASQARQTGRSINFREETNGMVYEIYLW